MNKGRQVKFVCLNERGYLSEAGLSGEGGEGGEAADYSAH